MSIQEQISNFRYLWDGSAPQWALLNIEAEGQTDYMMVNTESRAVKIIEDDELFKTVINELLSAYVRVVSRNNGF